MLLVLIKPLIWELNPKPYYFRPHDLSVSKQREKKGCARIAPL